MNNENICILYAFWTLFYFVHMDLVGSLVSCHDPLFHFLWNFTYNTPTYNTYSNCIKIDMTLTFVFIRICLINSK